ncbi:BppU family phage baseplate upper protein [Enterococcus faecalis]|uniref:BppU family phage baseplate upper protein n=1 Tax=Enterococcus faecalis TaxID=1351 RepID=UPI00177F3B0D|nr:BppU family phage baseplate upper protein [Enterococcus faecalis]MBD9891141.1 BppU family phage baseplate upper protein [Enterococcus faecalis]MDR0026348.1 BppU family phage baseplate upper protein [Enterococcus faecalis]
MHNKIGQLKVITSVANQRTIETNYIFYSYDKGSAAFDFRLKNQKNEALDLTNVTVKLLFTGVQDGEERKFTYLDSQPIIENPEEGRILYPLPDKLLNYEGEIKGYLYLDFEDGSHSDELSFTFTVVRSKIDSNMEEISEVYIKDFEQVKKEVFELAEKEKQEIATIRPELEASVSQLNEQIKSISEKVEVNHTETNRLLQLIAEKELLTVNEFLVALSRGYFEFTRELTFEGKVVGSFVENPNFATDTHSISVKKFSMPSPYERYREVSPYPDAITAWGYEAFRGNRIRTAGISGWDNNPFHVFLLIQWDIVEEIKRWLGEEYYSCFDATTSEKQKELVEKGLYSITPSTYANGYHGMQADGYSKGKYGVASLWYENSSCQWVEFERNTGKDLKTMTATIEKNNQTQFLDDKGRVNILMMGGSGARVKIDYGKTTLKFTYRIYLSDILYYKKDPTIHRMQTQIQQLWDKVFGI